MRDRHIVLLTLATITTYILIVIGAVISIKDIAAACETWPTCNGYLVPPLSETTMLMAWSHRVFAFLTGGLLIASFITSIKTDQSNRINLAIAIAAALFIGQIFIGAAVTLLSLSWLPVLHLLFAMTIFILVLLALTWSLEAELPATYRVIKSNQEQITEPDPHSVDNPNKASLPVQYFRLMKPRLMWLLCLVAVGGMALAVAAGHTISMNTAIATLIGGCLAVGASGTFNMVLERDIDKEMERTKHRPISQEGIPPRNAYIFGAALTALSITVFLVFVNALAMALGLLAILFYSVGYTLILKPNTKQNIVIGGAVGAAPALIGWAAATNSIGLPALILGGIVFLWTPAHFYNLAIVYRDDYEASGMPMLPVVEGETKTLRNMMYYLGATLLGAAVLGVVTPLSWIYAAVVVAMGAVFIYMLVELYNEQTESAAMKTFYASNLYLGVVIVAVILDVLFL